MNASVASRAHRLLRDRRIITSLAALAIITVLSAQLFVIGVDNFMVLIHADSFIQDWEISYLAPPKPLDPDIVIVAVNEETLKNFPYRSPLDRGFIADLLTKIGAAHPRAIGIDYLFDGPTEPDKDARLKSAIANSKVPLAVAYTERPADVTQEQLAYLRDFVPPAWRAFAILNTDDYDTPRFTDPGEKSSDGRYIPGFDRLLAQFAGVKSPNVPLRIVWTRPHRSLHLIHRGEDADPSYFYKSSFLELGAHVARLFPPQTFANKIVLIGSDESLIDRHRTPFAAISDKGLLAGIVIHAYALAAILHHEHSPYTGWKTNFSVALILSLIGAVMGMLNFRLVLRIVALFGILLAFWIGGALLYTYGNTMIGLLAPSLAMVGSFSAMDSITGLDARRQRQFIQGAFSRYVSPKVVEALIADPSRMSLEGERREMTYLFTDIAGFTTTSETMDSKVLAKVLNSYFDGMTSIVLRHEGMLDKFIGDAVFAIFNAPVDLADHQKRAVACALEMDAFCEKFRKEQQADGIDFGITRIGVHTGPAVVGNFGSHARFNYTAQGDAVNTASRLEGLNKHFGTHMCVSGATRGACGDMSFRRIASVIVKGKTQAIDVWEPLHDGVMTAEQQGRYAEAFSHLDEPTDVALNLFEGLARELPDDPCVKFYLHRLREGVRGTDLHMTEK